MLHEISNRSLAIRIGCLGGGEPVIYWLFHSFQEIAIMGIDGGWIVYLPLG